MSNQLAKSALEILLEVYKRLFEEGTQAEWRLFNARQFLQTNNRGQWAIDRYRELLKEETQEPTAQDYKDALTVQDACNISGVVYSFARVMARVNNQMARLKESSEWRGQHPIVRLYAEQIAHFGHVADTGAYRHAYEACKLLSTPPEPKEKKNA